MATKIDRIFAHTSASERVLLVPQQAAHARLGASSLTKDRLAVLVILVDAHPRRDWLRVAVEKRLREELAELQVEINEEKIRIVASGYGVTLLPEVAIDVEVRDE